MAQAFRAENSPGDLLSLISQAIPAMFTKAFLVSSLFTCLLALRDESAFHGIMRTESRTESRLEQGGGAEMKSVPMAVSMAVRKLKGKVHRKMTALEEQLKGVTKQEKLAEEAEAEKKKTLEAVEKHTEEFTARAQKSREALAALEEAMVTHTAKGQAFEEAKSHWKSLDDEVVALGANFTAAKEKATQLMMKMSEELKEKEATLEKKKLERDEAEKAMKEKEEDLERAGEVKQKKRDERDQAEAETCLDFQHSFLLHGYIYIYLSLSLFSPIFAIF